MTQSNAIFRFGPKLSVLMGFVWLLACCHAGCAPQTGHAKFKWKAKDFFDDAKVIALCKAIEANDLKEMERVIKEGADVNAKGKGNMTPLLWAFLDNHPERFTLLLEHGADPNVVVESDFGTPYGVISPGTCVTELAAKSRFPRLFEEVMKHGGNPNFVNAKSKECILTLVIRKGGQSTPSRVQLLIDKGADLNMMSNGRPPVIEAAMTYGQYELALSLLKAGADPKLYIDDGAMKLTHILLGAKDSVYKYDGPETQAAYERLVSWLKEHGESFEEAQADLDRWDKRAHLSIKENARLRRAEVAERKAREAAEKAKKEEANKEKKP